MNGVFWGVPVNVWTIIAALTTACRPDPQRRSTW